MAHAVPPQHIAKLIRTTTGQVTSDSTGLMSLVIIRVRILLLVFCCVLDVLDVLEFGDCVLDVLCIASQFIGHGTGIIFEIRSILNGCRRYGSIYG